MITLKMLKEAGACLEQQDLFEQHFGDSVAVTTESAVAVASVFDWKWAADHLLTAAQQEQYNKVTASAWEQYNKITAPAREQYYKAMASAREQYDKAMASAREQYYEATALAFVEAWKSER